MARPASKTVALPAIIDLDSLDAIRDALAEGLESGAVTVQADRVERVSTNALFLLLSAAETARHHKFDYSIASPSPALNAAIERLGLAGRFEGHFTP